MDKLTKQVIYYKKIGDGKVITEIIKLSERLIYSICKYYRIEKFPKDIQEDIIEDCKSLVLSKTIKAFDETKKAKFSTFYRWRLMSFIRNRKEFYLRRRELSDTVVLSNNVKEDNENYDEGNFISAESITHSNYSYRNLFTHKRLMARIFGLI